jgi:perosamine synthetase
MNISELASIQSEPGAMAPTGMIPLSVPQLQGNEWNYVKECLDSNWVSSAGPFVDRFERMVADYVGTRRAVATATGTAALHIALLVAGVEPDDEVLVPTLTFIAPANAIRYVGAWPVFMDVEPVHWQMDPQKVSDFLENECRWTNGELRNKTTGRRVKATLPVHILGHPCDMDPIIDLARRFHLVVIEDATESLGAKYKGRMVGQLGDIACFSFNGNKVITTGGGGMVVTDNDTWAARIRYLTTQAKDDPVEYIHKEIGYNYRLTNIQAALGCAQMEQLDNYVAAKRQIMEVYQDAVRNLRGVGIHAEAPTVFSTRWMSTITIDANEFGHDSRWLMHELKLKTIQTRPLWHPVNTLPPYQACQSFQVRIANQLYKDALNLPCSVALTRTDQSRVTEAIRSLAS